MPAAAKLAKHLEFNPNWTRSNAGRITSYWSIVNDDGWRISENQLRINKICSARSYWYNFYGYTPDLKEIFGAGASCYMPYCAVHYPLMMRHMQMISSPEEMIEETRKVRTKFGQETKKSVETRKRDEKKPQDKNAPVYTETITKIVNTETTYDGRDKKGKYEKRSEDRDRKSDQKLIVRTGDEVRNPEEAKDKTLDWTETRVIEDEKPDQINKKPVKQAEKAPEEKKPGVTKSGKDQSFGREKLIPARCRLELCGKTETLENVKMAADGLTIKSLGKTKIYEIYKFSGIT